MAGRRCRTVERRARPPGPSGMADRPAVTAWSCCRAFPFSYAAHAFHPLRQNRLIGGGMWSQGRCVTFPPGAMRNRLDTGPRERTDGVARPSAPSQQYPCRREHPFPTVVWARRAPRGVTKVHLPRHRPPNRRFSRLRLRISGRVRPRRGLTFLVRMIIAAYPLNRKGLAQTSRNGQIPPAHRLG